MSLLPLLLTISATQDPPRHPIWSRRIRFEGVPLRIRIWRKRDAPTEVEVVGNGVDSIVCDDLFFDGSVRPFLRIEGDTAFFAYAADPGAGSGMYASVWKISNRGHAVSQLGIYRYGDLRNWFRTGAIREIRPGKYATKDVLRVYPNLFDGHESSLGREFMIYYTFDPKAKRFRFLRVRTTSPDLEIYGTVRFPRR